ncbi:YndM family protein [Salimicrobium halophilum]|uniref:DUF2512 family protein n=1 Tax=Salimicrobium halophilum TaxID=86666 RepID=A0A1G8R599_9BACI|nr:YndM family protein [Salimicrobium halophilum]SDJ12129.1 Protein of unknown function [Salimicrobium halophilum]
MTHFRLFATKFLITFGILLVILGMGFDVSFGNVFLISLVLAGIGYLGDALLLPSTNNSIATGGDFVLTFAVVYFMSDALTIGDGVFAASLISALSLTIFEYFFHQSVARSIENEKKEMREVNPSADLRTEASKEIFPYDQENQENDER